MHKLFAIALFFCTHMSLQAQDVPNIKLVTLKGNSFQTQKFNELSSKPVVLSFWASWCIPCINELTAINDNLESWKENLKFEFYAISEDDSRTTKRVQPLVSGKGWEFEVLLDKNQDLKRELNVVNIPYIIIVKNGKIIYRRLGYIAGNENEVHKIIMENQ